MLSLTPPPHVLPVRLAHQTMTGAEIRKRLVQLHYLPFYLTGRSRRGRHIVYHYRWAFKIPPVLRRLVSQYAWTDPYNPWVLGALYQFEAAQGLAIRSGRDGILGLPESVVRALRRARRHDPWPWAWVLVSKRPRPETLRLFVAGQGLVLQAPCNTGVLDSTPVGTWPVYARAGRVRMSGLFPIAVQVNFVRIYDDALRANLGVKLLSFYRYHHAWVWNQAYNDPDVRWVDYFYAGRAIHFFPRTAYGFPQSAGCVELPRQAARRAFARLRLGVPVSVIENLPKGLLGTPSGINRSVSSRPGLLEFKKLNQRHI